MKLVKCKTFSVHGIGATYEHLRRKRVRTPEGMWVVPNMRHLDNAQHLLGMAGCSSVPTPMVKEVDAYDSEVDPELDSHEAAVYRSASICHCYI